MSDFLDDLKNADPYADPDHVCDLIVDVVDEIERLRAQVAALREALRRWQHYGCPDCGGDCGSANPPVNCCIMQETRAALTAPAPGGEEEARAIIKAFMACPEIADCDPRDKDAETLALESRALRFLNRAAPAPGGERNVSEDEHRMLDKALRASTELAYEIEPASPRDGGE